MDACVFESNHTVADLVRVDVSDCHTIEYQRSFTYILDHRGFGVLLELEQNNVYNRHLESLDEERSTVAEYLQIEVEVEMQMRHVLILMTFSFRS
jgi:hypothetical protein